MIFKLRVTKYFYTNKNQINSLKKLGFTFKKSKSEFEILGEPMLEINTLEELLQFYSEYGKLVITANTIEIYND